MSNYVKQEYDFIRRTKTIIEQYENFQIDKNEKFEVTLFLNCLVGLLILPKENWFNDLPKEIVSKDKWGIDCSTISLIKEGEDKSVKNVARHLRNSIAHYKFKAFNHSSGEIKSIRFEDFDTKKIMTFKAEISIAGLRKFTSELTDMLLLKMDSTK